MACAYDVAVDPDRDLSEEVSIRVGGGVGNQNLVGEMGREAKEGEDMFTASALTSHTQSSTTTTAATPIAREILPQTSTFHRS
jgi:hypothetical protein